MQGLTLDVTPRVKRDVRHAMRIKHIGGVAVLAFVHNAVWWTSAILAGASVHNPEYWDGGPLVLILSFPLGWAPDSWYPGKIEYLMMALNSLLWGACLYGVLLKLSYFRKRSVLP
jgi:hypothetical protein